MAAAIAREKTAYSSLLRRPDTVRDDHGAVPPRLLPVELALARVPPARATTRPSTTVAA